MKTRLLIFCLLALTRIAGAQSDVPILVRLVGAPLDAKSAKVGDEFTAVVSVPLKLDGKVVLPKGSKVSGRVTYVEAQPKKKGDSSLGLIFEGAQLPNGTSVKIDGIVQAVALPADRGDSDDPFASMAHSAAANQRGGSPPAGANRSAPPTPDSLGATGIDRSRLATAVEHDGDLTLESLGVTGLEDAFLNLELSNKMQSSVITASKQNLKLPANTRMVLRVRPIPRWPEPDAK
jgi:hypothetical protein